MLGISEGRLAISSYGWRNNNSPVTGRWGSEIGRAEGTGEESLVGSVSRRDSRVYVRRMSEEELFQSGRIRGAVLVYASHRP